MGSFIFVPYEAPEDRPRRRNPRGSGKALSRWGPRIAQGWELDYPPWILHPRSSRRCISSHSTPALSYPSCSLQARIELFHIFSNLYLDIDLGRERHPLVMARPVSYHCLNTTRLGQDTGLGYQNWDSTWYPGAGHPSPGTYSRSHEDSWTGGGLHSMKSWGIFHQYPYSRYGDLHIKGTYKVKVHIK